MRAGLSVSTNAQSRLALRFNWKVFAVAFVFSFIVGVPSLILFRLFLLYLNIDSLQRLLPFLIQILSFIISPLLLFTAFYLMGRNIDLESNFLSVLVSLFVGSWAGHLVYLIIYVFISLVSESAQPILLSDLFVFLWAGFTLAFSSEFFVGFAALAMAYLVNKREEHGLSME